MAQPVNLKFTDETGIPVDNVLAYDTQGKSIGTTNSDGRLSTLYTGRVLYRRLGYVPGEVILMPGEDVAVRLTSLEIVTDSVMVTELPEKHGIGHWSSKKTNLVPLLVNGQLEHAYPFSVSDANSKYTYSHIALHLRFYGTSAPGQTSWDTELTIYTNENGLPGRAILRCAKRIPFRDATGAITQELSLGSALSLEPGEYFLGIATYGTSGEISVPSAQLKKDAEKSRGCSFSPKVEYQEPKWGIGMLQLKVANETDVFLRTNGVGKWNKVPGRRWIPMFQLLSTSEN